MIVLYISAFCKTLVSDCDADNEEESLKQIRHYPLLLQPSLVAGEEGNFYHCQSSFDILVFSRPESMIPVRLDLPYLVLTVR